MDLLGSDTIEFVIDLRGSGVLTGMAQVIVDYNDGIPNKILANDLSSFLKYTARLFLEFAILVLKIGSDLYSFFTLDRFKSFRNGYSKLLNVLDLLGSSNTLTGIVFSAI